MTAQRRFWLPGLVAAVAVTALLWWHPWAHGTEAIQGTALTVFPAVETAGLTPIQRRVVEQLHDQFEAQHPGTFYSAGVDEPWCADFVSWIMNAAGHPLTNPNSGSWRIPGVATLQDYYVSAGRLRPVDSGYLPQVGDVVIYAAESPFHQHTNIVIGYHDGAVTTVGGNEHGRIRAHRFALTDDPGVVGFGVL